MCNVLAPAATGRSRVAQRLYHCIANYIDRNCSIYRDAQSLFPDDGRALFDYIWHKGERAERGMIKAPQRAEAVTPESTFHSRNYRTNVANHALRG